jgi:hypothetical protein
MVKLQKAANIINKFIDYKIGIAGAFFFGGVVFGINYFATHKITSSVTVNIKQGSYTLLVGRNIYERVRKLCYYNKNGKTAFLFTG